MTSGRVGIVEVALLDADTQPVEIGTCVRQLGYPSARATSGHDTPLDRGADVSPKGAAV